MYIVWLVVVTIVVVVTVVELLEYKAIMNCVLNSWDIMIVRNERCVGIMVVGKERCVRNSVLIFLNVIV